jgi:hypothetical protein
MATTTSQRSTTPEDPGSTPEGTTVERLERLLDEWRARIDDLIVQADLASKDVAEAVRAKTAVAENAYLAARNRLGQMPKDAGANLGSMRQGFDKLVDDMRQAYQSAEAAIRRGSAD